MAHDHRMNPVGEPYLNRKIMDTPQGYLEKYPRLLHAIDMPDDRAINLVRRHQMGTSTSNEKRMLSNAASSTGRMVGRFRKPSPSFYTESQNRPFAGPPDRAYEYY